MDCMSLGTRERIIRSGLALLTEYSFGAMGLDGLLRAAGAPKGCFYHHFGSKQAFVAEVIDAYDAYFEERYVRLLKDTAVPPLERLDRWMLEARRGMARHGFRRGCLVGNLVQEIGPHDALLRDQLHALVRKWERWTCNLLQEAVDAGHLREGTDARLLARLFWGGWQGAILMAKLEGRARPLDEFRVQYLAQLPHAPGMPAARAREVC